MCEHALGDYAILLACKIFFCHVEIREVSISRGIAVGFRKETRCNCLAPLAHSSRREKKKPIYSNPIYFATEISIRLRDPQIQILHTTRTFVRSQSKFYYSLRRAVYLDKKQVRSIFCFSEFCGVKHLI